MRNKKLLQVIISILILVSMSAAFMLKPTHLMADDRNGVEIENLIPVSFGGWTSTKAEENQVVNPVQEATIKKIYAQTLSRIYKKNGQTVMLTIAYGKNQSDSTELHRPDVCYPAQGFRIDSKHSEILITKYGELHIERLMARNNYRLEPVTFWTVIGNRIVSGGLNTKLAKIEYGLKNKIPDGLLFRVSSVVESDLDKENAYTLQNNFIVDLVTNIDEFGRNWIAGLTEP